MIFGGILSDSDEESLSADFFSMIMNAKKDDSDYREYRLIDDLMAMINLNTMI